MKENTIASATFNPKVKTYWTLSGVLICAFTFVGIVFIPVVAILIWLISGRMLAAMSATLLERKLVVKRGIWFVVEKSIPLEKITDVALSQGPVMRMLGLYRLSFETAGASGQGALVSLIGINDAESFRETILEQKDKQSEKTPTVTTAPSALNESAPSADLQALTQSVQNIEKMLQKLMADKIADNTLNNTTDK
jgi:putative membrane protein